mmetsp:Transcript_26290/g.31890  ORF Transcript_26290/g.31890 Transcript_26290/m.31890 type:complete len:436 (-) Transcript_26290:441-1748(-)
MQSAALLESIDPKDASRLIMILDDAPAAAILMALGVDRCAQILDHTQVDRAAMFLYHMGKPFAAQVLCLIEDVEKAAQVMTTVDKEKLADLVSHMTDTAVANRLLRLMPARRVADALPLIRVNVCNNIVLKGDTATIVDWFSYTGLQDKATILGRIPRDHAARLLMEMSLEQRNTVMGLLEPAVQLQLQKLREHKFMKQFANKMKLAKFYNVVQLVIDYNKLRRQIAGVMKTMSHTLREIRDFARPCTTMAGLVTALIILTDGSQVAPEYVTWEGEFIHDENTTWRYVKKFLVLSGHNNTYEKMLRLTESVEDRQINRSQTRALMLCRNFIKRNLDKEKISKVYEPAQMMYNWMRIILAMFSHTQLAKYYTLSEDGNIIDASRLKPQKTRPQQVVKRKGSNYTDSSEWMDSNSTAVIADPKASPHRKGSGVMMKM